MELNVNALHKRCSRLVLLIFIQQHLKISVNLLLKATVFQNPTSVEMNTIDKKERMREQWSWRALFII